MPRVIVEIFDPPMCCSTGICGPTVDATLLRVNEALLALGKAYPERVEVRRYQPQTHPAAFIQQSEVTRLMREEGIGSLPVTVVGGAVIKKGAYPTYEELAASIEG